MHVFSDSSNYRKTGFAATCFHHHECHGALPPRHPPPRSPCRHQRAHTRRKGAAGFQGPQPLLQRAQRLASRLDPQMPAAADAHAGAEQPHWPAPAGVRPRAGSAREARLVAQPVHRRGSGGLREPDLTCPARFCPASGGCLRCTSISHTITCTAPRRSSASEQVIGRGGEGRERRGSVDSRFRGRSTVICTPTLETDAILQGMHFKWVLQTHICTT
jgi:hypothetical protein